MSNTTKNLKTLSDAVKEDEGRLKEQSEKSGCFIVKPANTWIEEAKLRPIPKMLFAEFWCEREVSVLFADTNVGKSILAVQIADSISSGHCIEGFKLELSP